MNIITMEKFKKLPVWAREEISSLENRIRFLEEEVSLLTHAEAENTCIEWGTNSIRHNSLPDISNVTFFFEEASVRMRKFIRLRFSTDKPGVKTLKIMGSDTFNIIPSASNVIDIAMED